jgi:hypothetical protein
MLEETYRRVSVWARRRIRQAASCPGKIIGHVRRLSGYAHTPTHSLPYSAVGMTNSAPKLNDPGHRLVTVFNLV